MISRMWATFVISRKISISFENSEGDLIERITGTLIWYYYICNREVWLLAHAISAAQDNHFLELGKLINEEAYSRERREIEVGNMKIDLFKEKGSQIIIGEVKKSSKFLEAAEMQLIFYLHKLKERGVKASGVLLFPREKKRITVELSEEKEEEIKQAMEEIKVIISRQKPPQPEKCKYCFKCAYREFCWA